MVKSTIESPSGRHPDLWRVEANRWIYSKFGSRYEQLLARKHDPVPGVQQGEELESADVPDRATAIALAHQYLDKHAEEATGRAGIEIHVRPPEAELFDPKVYEVPAETIAQARRLGLKGDVAAQIRRMVLEEATLSSDPRANLQAGRLLLRVERNQVTWIGPVDLPRRRLGKRTI